jgi:hypothetical protein
MDFIKKQKTKPIKDLTCCFVAAAVAVVHSSEEIFFGLQEGRSHEKMKVDYLKSSKSQSNHKHFCFTPLYKPIPYVKILSTHSSP